MRARALLVVVLVGCGARPAPPAPPEISHAEPPPRDAAVEDTAELDEPADPGEADAVCFEYCLRAHGPPGDFDDEGEYFVHEDERSAEQIAADEARCRSDCTGLPEVDIDACIATCVADGAGTEWSCGADCDPDPYDECRYTPCD